MDYVISNRARLDDATTLMFTGGEWTVTVLFALLNLS
jgi:hypothetical protein